MVSVNHPLADQSIASLFCEEIWKQNTAESLLIRTKALAYMDVGKGREQDAEALSASDSLSLRHMDVLNVENAGAIFNRNQIFHKISAQLIFLG